MHERCAHNLKNLAGFRFYELHFVACHVQKMSVLRCINGNIRKDKTRNEEICLKIEVAPNYKTQFIIIIVILDG